MLNTIMRSLGFVPTKIHLESMSDMLTQRAKKDAEHKSVTDKMSEAIKHYQSAFSDEVNAHDMTKASTAGLKAEIETLKREVMAATDDRLIPRLWVRDDGKTLKLELTKPSMPGDTVVLRQLSRNKANNETLAAIVRDANELFAAPKLTVPAKGTASGYLTDKPE